MLQALLPVGGAVLGGYEGYRRSGGDLGAALLGAGIGAATPAGFRAAGTALGATRLGAGALARMSSLGAKVGGPLTGAAIKAGAGPIAPIGAAPLTAAALGGGAAVLGSLVAPQIAGAVAPALARPVQGALSGAGAMGAGRPGTPGVYDFESGALPGGVGPLGPTEALGSTSWDIQNPLGRFAAQRTLKEMEVDSEIRNLNKLLAAQAPYSEGAKKAEYMRNLAAAGVRQNIATQAAMLQNAQRTAQQMGVNAASQMGQALTQQYQYS